MREETAVIVQSTGQVKKKEVLTVARGRCNG